MGQKGAANRGIYGTDISDIHQDCENGCILKENGEM
jgi:hypothetical protein